MYELIGEEGNAFVMNVLVCPKNKTGIDFHQDNTLDLAKGTSSEDHDPNKDCDSIRTDATGGWRD